MIFTASGFVLSDVLLMARVVGSDGLVLAPSGVTSATFSICDLDSDSPTVPVMSGPLTVSGVFFDHLIIDERWGNTDSVGYNLRVGLTGKAFVQPDHLYRIEIRGTATTGEVFVVAWDYLTLRTYGPFPAQGNVSRSLSVNWESR